MEPTYFENQAFWVKENAFLSSKNPVSHEQLKTLTEFVEQRYEGVNSLLSKKLFSGVIDLFRDLRHFPKAHESMQIWIAENDYEVWILGEHLFEGPYYYWSHYQECKAARYDAELMRKAIRKYYKSQMGERSASKDLFLIDLFRRVDDMFIQETPIDETTNQIQILLQFSKLYCSVDKK